MTQQYDHDREQEIFANALDMPNKDRQAYLDSVCAENPQMRSQIMELLEAYDQAGSKGFLGQPTGGLGQEHKNEIDKHPEEQVGATIGPYTLVKQIGQGGFGTVWMADQNEPVKRRVALKIIKLGMDSKQVVERFQAERQTLAMMDHPNIAKVFDAGSTETGRPFFVMELVKGVPILDYCDAHQLDTISRLKLFASVCLAIQHAHQKSIIHRDIKPGNVLVTMHDGMPVPKVIDFGIAKATSQELAQKTLFTENHQMVGTPAYMSPEQAEMSEIDIDTRSDIYSLGVLLYEMLTGTTPFAHQELVERGFGEMMRIIREDTPHKPSTRLSTLGEMSSSTAQRRHTDIRKLGLVLKGDLDWIVMKCLEKDRTRRYSTANGLAEDIQRHLKDEPVTAGPPSASYRMHKFVRRNRNTVIAGLTIVSILILGVVGTSYGIFWAMHERDLAINAQAESASRAEELQQVSEFQNKQLGDIDPQMMGLMVRKSIIENAPANIREQIEQDLSRVNFTNVAMSTLEDSFFKRTIETIDTQFADQPILQASLLQSLSETLQTLGLVNAAENPQRRAVDIRRKMIGIEHVDTLDSINSLGSLLQRQDKLDEAEMYYDEVIKISRRVLGDDHPSTLIALNNMGSVLEMQGNFPDAEVYIQESLEARRRVLGDDHPSTLTSLNFMGLLSNRQGKYIEAEMYYREVLDGRRRVLGVDHPQTLNAIRNLASALQVRGMLQEAEPYYLEAVEGYRRVYGDDHPDTLVSINGMGVLLYKLGKLDKAERLYLEVIEGSRRMLGGDHSLTLTAMNNMCALLMAQGKLVDAESYYHQVLDGRRRVLGEEHPSTLNTTNSLAYLKKTMGKLPEAEGYYRTALEARRRILGNEHPKTLNSISMLGSLSQDMGKFEEAEKYYIESLESNRLLLSNGDRGFVITSNNYGSLLNQLERYQDATNILGEAEPIARKLWLSKPSLFGSYLAKLGQAQAGESLFKEAELTLLESYSLLVNSEENDHTNSQTCAARLVDLYVAWQVADPDGGFDIKAEEWREKLLDTD
jgi:eukaryotic-like serine/threonine-protein kinase